MTYQLSFATEISSDEHSPAIRHFFDNILGLDVASCFVSEESELSDFSFSGSDFLPEKGSPLSSLYRSWDQWVIHRLKEEFSIEISSTKIVMKDLFKMLEEGNPTLH